LFWYSFSERTKCPTNESNRAAVVPSDPVHIRIHMVGLVVYWFVSLLLLQHVTLVNKALSPMHGHFKLDDPLDYWGRSGLESGFSQKSYVKFCARSLHIE
jgi:hypothetical protein